MRAVPCNHNGGGRVTEAFPFDTPHRAAVIYSCWSLGLPSARDISGGAMTAAASFPAAGGAGAARDAVLALHIA